MDKPWTTGPKELLIHGLQHLEQKTDFDKRMSIICIDNSVEVMLKSFLELPKRINGIDGLTRKKMEEISQSFPLLLDSMEEFAEDKLNGVELGEIEFFHRLRNQLYHGGNGLTVETKQAETYGAIAKLLFYNLFGIEVKLDKQGNHSRLVGEFIMNWRDFVFILEKKFKNYVGAERWVPGKYIDWLSKNGKVDHKTQKLLRIVHSFRNDLVHGSERASEEKLEKLIGDLEKNELPRGRAIEVSSGKNLFLVL
jgi:hypothetical protein